MDNKVREPTPEASMLLDTNMLMAAVQFKIQWPKNTFTLSSCMEELEEMAKKKSNAAMQARATLALIKMKNLKVVRTQLKGDKAILDYVKKHECAAATNDKELIEKLKQRKVKVYRLRQKKMLIEA